jgi:hypothetical protein
LAVNAAGERVAVPESATGWRAWRHTRGRPRAVLASDGQPVTLPLDTTIDDLADELGPGAYRLRAVTSHGELLETSVDHEVGGDDEPAPTAMERRGSRTTREDITTLVNGLVEMGRSHARTSERLAEAQADWTKALAASKSLPKSIAVPVAPPSDSIALRNAAPKDDTGTEADEAEDSEEPDENQKMLDRVALIGTVATEFFKAAAPFAPVVGGLVMSFFNKGTNSAAGAAK